MVTGDAEESGILYGPQITQTEHQTAVFESMFERIGETYIHAGSVGLDMDSLKEKYMTEIEGGLDTDEFNRLMDEFTNEFPEGDILYVPREERIENETVGNTGVYGGIGAFVDFQAEELPHVVILDVIDGSPAEKAGLKAHDSIYAVDGDPVRLEEGADVVLRIRGEPGTKVVLTVQSPGKTERDVELTRAPINAVAGIESTEIPGTDIGYILLPTVGTDSVTNGVLDALENFSQNTDLKGVILDLRIAGVNSNFPLEEMLTLFLNGIEISIYDLEDSQTFKVEGQDFFGSQEIPLAVLVGENTSGDAEIFAAAVQENNRGTVVGADTPGSVESLNGFFLPNGGQIFIAFTSFRVGESESLGYEGLSPKVRVEAGWDDIIPGEDIVIEQAVQTLEEQK
jgi:carboxyl-terminal processing protease